MANTSWSGQHRNFPHATRRRILARYPDCVECGAPSTIADHEPNYMTLLRAGLDPNDERHGRGMCVPCHDVKTRREQREGRRTTRRTPEAHPGII